MCTFFDKPALVIWVEKHFCHLIGSVMVLKRFTLDGIVEDLDTHEQDDRER